jgi:hypothetical protein
MSEAEWEKREALEWGELRDKHKEWERDNVGDDTEEGEEV